MNLYQFRPVMDTYWTPIFNPQTFGERIRKARIYKVLLARDLTKKLGVSENSLLNWDKDKYKPKEKMRGNFGIY